MTAAPVWLEVGPGFFTRRYPFYDQNIGAILTEDEVVLIDTRTTPGHGREIKGDLRRLTRLPVRTVINTHGHSDHCFGNSVFRPATIWGQDGSVAFVRDTGERQRAALIAEFPDLAADLRAVELDPPDRTFDRAIDLDIGGRRIELRYFGRGHTDHDLVVVVPDSKVLWAGDLVEEDAPPYFGDAFPLDWPATLDGLLDLAGGPIVPGHGAIVDRDFVLGERSRHSELARVAREAVAAGEPIEAILDRVPYPQSSAREALGRAYAQLNGSI